MHPRGKVRPPTQAELAAAAEEETSLAPVPYFLDLDPDGLTRSALDVVPVQLRDRPLPPRVIDDYTELDEKYRFVGIAAPKSTK